MESYSGAAPPPPLPPLPPQLPTAQPPLPPGTAGGQSSWFHDGYAVHHNPDIPPISNLLLREADAWRAVLGLNATTIHSAQQLANEPHSSQLLFEDENALNSESREAAYCAALTSLASQCDTLIAEVLKLRTLRKARRCVEVRCVREIVRSHADEILAVGQTLASNGALNVASVTAEIRAAAQKQRNQVQQLRMLLEAVCGAAKLPLPKNGKLVIGVAADGEGVAETHDLDTVMASVFNDARELNEASLTTALARLFVQGAHRPGEGAGASRQFARRTGERGGGAAPVAAPSAEQQQ